MVSKIVLLPTPMGLFSTQPVFMPRLQGSHFQSTVATSENMMLQVLTKSLPSFETSSLLPQRNVSGFERSLSRSF